MTFDFRRSSLVFIALLIYWLIAASALWKVYDIGPLISGGYLSHGQAISVVTKMGLLLTVLTSGAWIWSSRQTSNKKTFLAVWRSAALRTFVVLFFYWLVVFIRREIWTPSQGVNDDAMFLPFIGHVNAVFFAEVGWLSFLIGIIPCMGIVSGFVFSLEQSMMRGAKI